jgi:hypothetical protein
VYYLPRKVSADDLALMRRIDELHLDYPFAGSRMLQTFLVREGYPDVQFERYADDAICHCRSEARAQELRLALEKRLAECRLRLHPDKTKIVYCKDANRKGTFPERACDFLGYTFRPRLAINRRGEHFVSFIPAVSKKAAVKMRRLVRAWRLHWRSDLDLDAIAEWVCPVLRGWVNYYGRFYPSQLRDELHDRRVPCALVAS